jgi:hypothetical protein
MPARAEALRRYIKHPDLVIDRPAPDVEDRVRARHVERQGLASSAQACRGAESMLSGVYHCSL